MSEQGYLFGVELVRWDDPAAQPTVAELDPIPVNARTEADAYRLAYAALRRRREELTEAERHYHHVIRVRYDGQVIHSLIIGRERGRPL